MAEARGFKARAIFGLGAVIGYGICIAVSLGYMAGRRWANVWPANIVTESLSLVASTWLILQSYLRIWISNEGIIMRSPRATRTLEWSDLSVYQLTGKNNSICTLKSFSGTTIRIRFSRFERAEELSQLIDGLATKPT